MSHNIEAAYASSEVADIIMRNQAGFFGTMGAAGAWSVFAGREGGHTWPLADGVINAQNTTASAVNIAFEFKRPNEGLHGILTALGQSFAYLEKGYNASVMVIPASYVSHSNPGEHIKKVIEATSPDVPISIYTYEPPNLSASRPFQGKLTCVRDISLPACRKITSTGATTRSSGSCSTLWAHIREGMSHPDAFFRYCQAVKIITAEDEGLSDIQIPPALENAVLEIAGNVDVYQYLSNTSGDSIAERAWRYVWFRYYFWADLMPIYTSSNPYVVNDTPTRIKKDESSYQKIFSGRTDSIKATLVDDLTAGNKTEEEAWKEYAKKVRKDSHSYREVIDSGLFHIGFLLQDGSLTDLGYKYVDACERVGNAYAGIPMELLRGAVLQNGRYAAMLHYFYKLSEEKFSKEFFAFATQDQNGEYTFDSTAYLNWLDDKFANELHISKKSTKRSGGTRKAFQAEMYFLKKLGLVKTKGKSAVYRVGGGLVINWPQVQSSVLYFEGLH